MPATRFIFPHAPIRPVSVNQGMPMRAWYDIQTVDLVRSEDEGGIRESAQSIGTLIEREPAPCIPRGHIVLAVFSPCCAIALFTRLRTAPPLAGTQSQNNVR